MVEPEAFSSDKPVVNPTPPNRSTYYTPQAIQEWQSVHGAGSMPPNYRPSTAPVSKPEIPSDTIYKGEVQQKQVQQDTLYQTRVAQQEQAIKEQSQQERIREANIQQSAYRQAVDSRQFRQADISKEAPVLPKQRTATSLDQAREEYNALITERTPETTKTPTPQTKPEEKNVTQTVREFTKPTTEPTKPVSTTKQSVTPKGSPEDLRMQLAEKQGEVKSTGGGGEAVSFLRFPFTQNKGTDSNSIKSTTILDPFQFFIGGAVGLASKGASLLAGIFKAEAKPIVKGTADIGLSLGAKTTKEVNEAKSSDALANFNRAVEASKGKGPTVYQTPQTKEFLKPAVESKPMTEDKISLGLGIGKQLSKEGGTVTEAKGPKPPGPPPETKPTTGTKEITSNTGLVQLMKQKEVSEVEKLVQSQKAETVKLGTGTAKVVKTETPKPKTVSTTEQILKSVQKKKEKEQEQTPLILTKPPEAKTSQERVTALIQTPKTETAQKERDLTGLVSKQTEGQGQGQPDLTGLIPATTPKQTTKQTTLPTPTEPTFTGLVIPNPPPGKPPTPPVKTPTPPEKPPGKPGKDTNDFEGLIRDDSKKYEKAIKGKSKKKQEFIGNAPIGSIVGIYKREDVVYGKEQVARLTRKDIARTERGTPSLVHEKHTGLLKKNQNTFTVPSPRKRKVKI